MEESNKFFYKITAGLAAIAVGLGIAIHSASPNKGNCSRTVEPAKITQYNYQDQTGKKVELKNLLTKSVNGKKAREYVRKLAEESFETRKEEYKTLEEKVNLVEEVMDRAIDFLKDKKYGGAGNYTEGYEYNPTKENWKKQAIEADIPEEIKKKQLKLLNAAKVRGADSIQTFDDFYGPKDGKILAGDCEDFSTSLTTVYHGLKDYAEANKDKDEFFESLAEGLNHYKIMSVFIEGHALNLSIKTINEPEFKVIDLTNMDYKWSIITPEFSQPIICESLGEAPTINPKSCSIFKNLYLMKKQNNRTPYTSKTYDIFLVFNKDFVSSGLQIREVCENE